MDVRRLSLDRDVNQVRTVLRQRPPTSSPPQELQPSMNMRSHLGRLELRRTASVSPHWGWLTKFYHGTDRPAPEV
jgi:hypothetical protein